MFQEQLLKQFICSEIYTIKQTDFDKVLINLQNGTFEISIHGNTLRPFNRNDFLTYQLPFKYNPEAQAPIFMNFLNRVLPDKDCQMVIAEFLGYVFVRNGSKAIKQEKALLLYGLGANGKSVFFEVMLAVLGKSNVCSHQLSVLTSPKDGESYRAKLANKLVNYTTEINGKLDTAIFKQMVSGEPISARMLYGQPFEMENYAKLIFNCNELPKDVEHTNAYFRRFLIIPFDVTIPDEEQDKNLHSKIIADELSGVFNWMLDGLKRLLLQQKFTNCEASNKALEQYKNESNSLKMFLDECGYKISSDQYERIGSLYSEYKTFCINEGLYPFKKINFSKQLQSLGVRLGRENGTGQKIAYLEKDNELF
jgi:putative DNA primase/helicase